MAINFHPKAKQVLMCDFSLGGFVEPEMVKRRPVVVLSHKRHNSATCLIVPLSTTQPAPIQSFHHQLRDQSLPRKLQGSPTWVKGNMIAHVALRRLDRFNHRSSVTGLRTYESTLVCEADWQAIQRCIAAALGLPQPATKDSDDGVPF